MDKILNTVLGYSIISVKSMREECAEKEDDISLIKSLFESMSTVGRTWNNKSVQQVLSELEHTLKEVIISFCLNLIMLS